MPPPICSTFGRSPSAVKHAERQRLLHRQEPRSRCMLPAIHSLCCLNARVAPARRKRRGRHRHGAGGDADRDAAAESGTEPPPPAAARQRRRRRRHRIGAGAAAAADHERAADRCRRHAPHLPSRAADTPPSYGVRPNRHPSDSKGRSLGGTLSLPLFHRKFSRPLERDLARRSSRNVNRDA
jgi:hypothetical protein